LAANRKPGLKQREVGSSFLWLRFASPPGQQVVRATQDSDPDGLRGDVPSPPPGRRRLPWRPALLATVILLQVGVVLTEHEANFLSQAVLPISGAGLPAGMDPALGRVIALDDHVPVADAYRFFTHAYGTWFEVPSLGGYNPLVSSERLNFGMGLDVPNVYDRPITPEVRAELESRAVRYWVVDPNSSRRAEVEALDGLKLLGAGSGPYGYAEGAYPLDRLIYEDMRAEPVAFAVATPNVALAVRYVGNSMLIRLDGGAGMVAVSVGPTDGWWYRVDGGAWKNPDYRDLRLYIPVSENGRELEISYFDPRLRTGFCISLIIIGLITILVLAFRLTAGRFGWVR
jgi:hypothetical protein